MNQVFFAWSVPCAASFHAAWRKAFCPMFKVPRPNYNSCFLEFLVQFPTGVYYSKTPEESVPQLRGPPKTWKKPLQISLGTFWELLKGRQRRIWVSLSRDDLRGSKCCGKLARPKSNSRSNGKQTRRHMLQPDLCAGKDLGLLLFGSKQGYFRHLY